MIGIYKIVSPTNKIYIGQSLDLKKRIAKYKTLACKNQRKLYLSLKKYGFDNHLFEVIHELPLDTDISVLNSYEEFYWKLYLDCGYEMLNLVKPGNNARHSEESKKRISKSLMGSKNPMWGKKHSAATKQKMSEAHILRFQEELAKRA